MDAIQTILRQLDDAWSHAYESVLSVMEGVTEAEAAWQAPAYKDAPAATPPAGSILWQVAHLAHCKRDYTAHVRDRGTQTDTSGVEQAAPRTLADGRLALQAAHTALRAQVAALTPEDLSLAANDAMALDEFLAMVIRHDTWHAGQIAVARRLYRTAHP